MRHRPKASSGSLLRPKLGGLKNRDLEIVGVSVTIEEMRAQGVHPTQDRTPSPQQFGPNTPKPSSPPHSRPEPPYRGGPLGWPLGAAKDMSCADRQVLQTFLVRRPTSAFDQA